jgi:hypothetical protein
MLASHARSAHGDLLGASSMIGVRGARWCATPLVRTAINRRRG